ncbi:MAG: proline iminopeptidase-family hydrolase [Methanotrichaceae archaeon]|nr:proline iminopeptidase-family hydrolase [Methanotrichaceae archaeon]
MITIAGFHYSKGEAKTQEGYIDVTGGRVWYKAVGIDREGIPLLILHGGPGAPHDYLEPLEALSDERPVIFYDQLGCGNSDMPDDPSLWTVEHFVEELSQVRDTLGLDEVHILGQSWGTMLTVDYMLTEGSKGVLSLVLAGPCLSAPRFVSDQREYLRQLPEDVQKTILESEASGNFSSKAYQDAMMTYYRLHVCRMGPWPDCLNRTFEKLGHKVYEYMWGPSEFTIKGTLADYNRSDRLKEIKVPVLFTCGRYDEATPSATAYYNSMLPGSEMVIFEDASHETHLEKSTEYLRTARDFLRRSESGRH